MRLCHTCYKFETAVLMTLAKEAIHVFALLLFQCWTESDFIFSVIMHMSVHVHAHVSLWQIGRCVCSSRPLVLVEGPYMHGFCAAFGFEQYLFMNVWWMSVYTFKNNNNNNKLLRRKLKSWEASTTNLYASKPMKYVYNIIS